MATHQICDFYINNDALISLSTDLKKKFRINKKKNASFRNISHTIIMQHYADIG